jgi:hypothetical protein
MILMAAATLVIRIQTVFKIQQGFILDIGIGSQIPAERIRR